MRRFVIQTVAASMLLLVLAACGGSEPLTVREIEQTRVAEATAVVNQVSDAEATREALLANIAPEGTVFSDEPVTAGHDQNLRIPFGPLPPNGGTHNPAWQTCDIYDAPVRPEHVVHSLEHGAVWVTYQPDLEEDDVELLKDQVRGERYVILSPYPELRSPVVLTAWGIQLEVDSADDERIEEFLDAFVTGPQTPERGASCTGGVTTTVDG